MNTRRQVLLEMLIQNGSSKEYRRLRCHENNVSLVKRKMMRFGVILGCSVTVIDDQEVRSQ